MFYEIKDKVSVIQLDEISEENITVGVISLEEFTDTFADYNFSELTLEQCNKETATKRCFVDRYNDYYFGILNVMDYDNMFEERPRIAVYLKKNYLLIVKIIEKDTILDDIIADTLARLAPNKLYFERLVYTFFDRIMNKEKNKIEYYDKSVETLEDRVLSNDISKDIPNKISITKKVLTSLKKYYDQLADIGEMLLENEIGVFNNKQHSSIDLFASKAQRQSAIVQQTIDNLNQVRESYQGLLDHSINQTMKVLALMSAIFLPLTLLVGWYGMNFTSMPELTWNYGYIGFVVVAFVLVTSLFIFFKKKKFW